MALDVVINIREESEKQNLLYFRTGSWVSAGGKKKSKKQDSLLRYIKYIYFSYTKRHIHTTAPIVKTQR